LEEEETILTAAATQDRVAVDIIGHSVEGRPIRAVRIGAPTPRPMTDRAALVILCCQHGHEPAGREAVLQLLIDDLATTVDAGVVGLLETHNVVIIPTVNPDGFSAERRENANDEDLNRDHIALTQPETRAVHTVLGQCRPLALLDAHETTGTQTHGADVAFRGSSNAQISDEVLALSADLLVDVQARMTADSWSHDLYGDGPTATSGGENVMLQNAGLQHIVSLLIESHGFGGSELPEDDRRDIHYAVMDETVAWLVANLSTIVSDIDAGIATAVADGAAGTLFDFSNTVTLDPAPLGYRLSGSGYALTVFHRQVYNIEAVGSVVTMAQAGHPIIPHLFDAAAPSVVAAAIQLFDLSASTAVTVTDPTQFAPIISGSHQPVFEARVLASFQAGADPDGDLLSILAGDVQFDATAEVFASLELTTAGFDEDNGRSRFPRLPGDLLAPYGNEVFVRRGVDIGSAVLWAPLGYFRIDSAEQAGAPYGEINLSGRDRMAGIIDARLPVARTFAPSDSVAFFFAAMVGEVYPAATVTFDDDTAFADLGRRITVERERYEALAEVAQSFGKLLHWDGEGVLRVESAPDESVPVWEVKAGRNGVLVTAARRVNREGVVNGWVYTGEGGGDQKPVRAIVVDVGPNSPTRWGGPFGKVPGFHASPLIVTEAQAEAAATARLRRSLGAPHSADFGVVVNPALRPWHPVRVTQQDGNREIHVVQTCGVPLVAEAHMTGTTREKTHVLLGRVTS
jgi:hypothetical protein